MKSRRRERGVIGPVSYWVEEDFDCDKRISPGSEKSYREKSCLESHCSQSRSLFMSRKNLRGMW
jgi:hypothetical protein